MVGYGLLTSMSTSDYLRRGKLRWSSASKNLGVDIPMKFKKNNVVLYAVK